MARVPKMATSFPPPLSPSPPLSPLPSLPSLPLQKIVAVFAPPPRVCAIPAKPLGPLPHPSLPSLSPLPSLSLLSPVPLSPLLFLSLQFLPSLPLSLPSLSPFPSSVRWRLSLTVLLRNVRGDGDALLLAIIRPRRKLNHRIQRNRKPGAILPLLAREITIQQT